MAQVMLTPVPNPSGLAPRTHPLVGGERRKPLSPYALQPFTDWMFSHFFVDWWAANWLIIQKGRLHRCGRSI